MKFKIDSASPVIQDLYKAAMSARQKAYCKYSGFKVGAAIQTTDGKIYSGCNVENSSFGATTCAERVAIHTAICDRGDIRLQAVLVVTDSDPAWPPCGICRQVIAEFGDPVSIYLADLHGHYRSKTLNELLPDAFNSAFLAKKP